MEDEIKNPQSFNQEGAESAYDLVMHALENAPHKIAGILEPLHPSDIADILEKITPEQRRMVVPFIAADTFSDVVAELSFGVQEGILQGLSKEELAEVLPKLNSDDAVDLVQSLEEDRQEEVLELISDREQELLEFDEDSAGGMMQLEVFSVPPSWKVAEVLDYLRENGENLPEDVHTVFVVDSKKRLQGTVSLKRLVRLSLEDEIKDVMRSEPVSVMPNASPKDVARVFEKYDVLSCAVVNENGRLLGRITVDDVLADVMAERENLLARQAGLEEGGDIFAPVMQTTKNRFPWLLINLFTAVLASMVIAMFAGDIEQLVALAVLMPIVASMGGNAGTQTLAVTVRGLAMNQVTVKNALYLLRKEFYVGSFNGLLLGVLVAAGTIVVYGNFMLGMVILFATIANHIFAALAGNIIPIILEKFGKDPAISSGVLVTTVTDVGGFFTFLGLASIFLL